MPPKNAGKGGNQSKKTEQKKKDKVVEDKTFGLKNKKGGKQQKFIQVVQKQVYNASNKSARQVEKEREEMKNKKDDKKKELAEINDLFKPVAQQIAKGVDPKSVLCSYFKQGTCLKGNKCKFSHDLNIERKSEKRNAYFDGRDDKETSENWDEATLKEVVEKKHGNESSKSTTTQIICKFFLDAVEDGKYGWFWNCPNGDKCIYRHALPPGFVLKKDRKKMDKDKEEISLEDLIETQRASLGTETTKVTLQTFLAWKKKKLVERAAEVKKASDKKKSDFRSGKQGGISGREMFIFNPDLAVGENMMEEEGDGDFDIRNMGRDPLNEEDGDDSEIQYKELDLNSLMEEYKDIDPDGALLSMMNCDDEQQPGVSNNLNRKVDIDEDLFGGDDLQELEDELEELAVNS